jgi:predicted Zn-ribbon and HTH transcriptional regulator
MTAALETFRCMMCGYEYEELVVKGEDKERTCAKCRSNSIRHLRAKRAPKKEASSDRASR